MRTLYLGVVVLLIAGLVGCGPGAAGSTSKPSSTGAAAPAAPSAASGQAAGANSALLQAAAREGELDLYAASTLGREAIEELQDGFNRHYGLNATIKFTGSGSMTADAARVVTEISSGQPPTWDLMLLTDAHYATLFTNGVLEPTDWAALGVTNPKSIAYDGTSFTFASGFVAPAYNPNIVAAGDAPKDWTDLADPRWKGKVGVATTTHHWARLAQVWGDERTTRLIQGIASQQPMLGRLQDIYRSITTGELSIFASATDSYQAESKRTGAPFAMVETVKPLIMANYMGGILKGVRHPNLARLLAVYLVTPEGQAIWDKHQEQTSMYVEGTPMYRFVQGKELAVLDAKFATDQLDDLTQKYGRMVGFR